MQAFLICAALVFIALGTLPYLQHKQFLKLEQGQLVYENIERLPFSIIPAGRYIKNTLSNPEVDKKKLEQKVRENITIRPFFAFPWLDLAELQYQKGNLEIASKYADRAVSLWPNNSYFLYLAGSFFIKLEQIDKAITLFSRYLNILPTEINTVITIVNLLEKDTDKLIDIMFSANALGLENQQLHAKRILVYSIKKNKFELAASVWRKFESTFVLDQQLAVQYIEYLINKNQLEIAVDIWSLFNPKQNVVEAFINPSFESEPIGGLDWIIRKHNDVNVDFDNAVFFDGNQSLKLEFLGQKNVSFKHVYQVIPVVAGKNYKVSAYWRAEKITTRSTPYLELASGKAESTVVVRSESKLNSWRWQKVEAQIKIPIDANSLTIRIKRNSTKSLDKNIEGSLWFDAFSVEEMAL